MTIDEEIKHQEEISDRYARMTEYEENEGNEGIAKDCAQCAADHRQLAEWLTELQELKLQIAAPRLGSIEEYHYELAKCKAAFWSCNRSCMDAKEQYRRKADELRKAQQQIAEYKRLLKAALADMNNGGCNSNCYKCKYCGVCDYSERFTWKLTDEAEKLIGGSE
jgi:hypothetical protein